MKDSKSAKSQSDVAQSASRNYRDEHRMSASSAQETQADKEIIIKERYLIESLLYKDFDGLVFKAQDLQANTSQNDGTARVALKVFDIDARAHSEAIVALHGQVLKLQQLKHPNIVEIYDFDKDGECAYMVMEYPLGKSLDAYFNRNKLLAMPESFTNYVLSGLYSALSYAHQNEVIHANLNPSCIFVTADNQVKLMGFDIVSSTKVIKDAAFRSRGKKERQNSQAVKTAEPYKSIELTAGYELPDERDDIYSLSCIAYHLYTGAHPFNGVGAREARFRNIQPVKPENIEKNKWRALENGLLFERKKRTPSIEKFQQDMEGKKPKNKIGIIIAEVAVVLILGFSWFAVSYFSKEEAIEKLVEKETRLTSQLGVEAANEKINRLINEASFDENWEDEIWYTIDALQQEQVVEIDSFWLDLVKSQLVDLYSNQIFKEVEDGDFGKARIHLLNIRRYTDDPEVLSSLAKKIVSALKDIDTSQAASVIAAQVAEQEAKQKQQALANEEARIAEQRSIAALKEQKEAEAKAAADKLVEEAKLQLREVTEQIAKKQEQETEDRIANPDQDTDPLVAMLDKQEFDTTLSSLNDDLDCAGRLNMAGIRSSVANLRRLDGNRYQSLEAGLVRKLTDCIAKVGKRSPARAREQKKSAQRLFPGNMLIRDLDVSPTDVCNQSLAGYGARGKRAHCADEIPGVGVGPSLVVVPSSQGLQSFAISRFEVSISDFNKYCRDTEVCTPLNQNVDFPISGIDIDAVNQYLSWLSQQTKKRYRLPSRREWLYAARGQNRSVAENRNCKFESLGIYKGGAMVKANIGEQNNWGLVNYLGNVAEWVQIGPSRVAAVGGSFDTPLEDCTFNFQMRSNGQADKQIGFRVLRELSE